MTIFYNTNKFEKHKWTIKLVKLSFDVALSLLIIILLYIMKVSFNDSSKVNTISDVLHLVLKKKNCLDIILQGTKISAYQCVRRH
jgi:hypothetical protein